MTVSCRNGDNVSPARHIALTIRIFTRSHDRAVRLQADGVLPSCRNSDNRYAALFLCASCQRTVTCGCCTIEQCPQGRLVIASQFVCCGKSIINLRLLRVNLNRRGKCNDGLLIIALGQVAHAEVILCLPAGGFVRRFGGFRGFLARGKRQQQQRCQKDIKEAFHIDSPIAYRFPVRAGSRVPDLYGFYHVIKRDLAVEIYIRVDPQLCQRGHV